MIRFCSYLWSPNCGNEKESHTTAKEVNWDVVCGVSVVTEPFWAVPDGAGRLLIWLGLCVSEPLRA